MKLSDAAKAVFYISGAVFFALLALCVVDLRLYTQHELKPMLNARDAQIAALLTTVDATSKKNAENIEVTLANLKALTGDADDSIEQVTSALLDDKFGLIPHADALLASFTQVANDADAATITLNVEIAKTGNFARAQLAPLSADLASVDALVKDAQKQIAANGQASQVTLVALGKAIDDADKLLADPQIMQTIGHVDSSMESIDIALKPWRQKATLLKIILTKIFDAALYVVPGLLK